MKAKTLKIGTRNLAAITQEEVLQVAIIEGCHPHLEFWGKPIVTDFNNTMFSTTVVIDYHSLRKEDDSKSPTIMFFFNFEKFDFHYHQTNIARSESKKFSLETIKYLLKQGFYLPITD